jgi:hypothetical protein
MNNVFSTILYSAHIIYQGRSILPGHHDISTGEN